MAEIENVEIEVNDSTEEVKQEVSNNEEVVKEEKVEVETSDIKDEGKQEDKKENETNDTGEYTKEDIEKNKTMAILSYILPFIPYFAEKESKWVRYHAIQGMNLLIIAIVISIASQILYMILGWSLWWVVNAITSICSLGIFVLAILGIMNVSKGEAKELPIIGNIKIIKQ